MSTSDLYILNGKSTKHFAEFRNGWGSAPICWNHLGKKYLGGDAPGMFGDMQRVLDLAGDSRVAHHEKVALMMTFDRAYIPIANLDDAAAACEQFGAECADGERVNHWPAFAQALRRAAKMKHSRHARGVVMSATSVSDMWGCPSSEWLDDAWPIFEAKEQTEIKP